MPLKYLLSSFAIVVTSLVVLSILSNIPERTKSVTLNEIIAVYNKLCTLKDVSLSCDVNIYNIESELRIGDIKLKITRIKIVFPIEYSLPFNGTYRGKPFALTGKGIVSWVVLNDNGETLTIKYFYSEVSRSSILSFEEEVEKVFKGVFNADIVVDGQHIYKLQGYRTIVLIRIHVKG